MPAAAVVTIETRFDAHAREDFTARRAAAQLSVSSVD